VYLAKYHMHVYVSPDLFHLAGATASDPRRVGRVDGARAGGLHPVQARLEGVVFLLYSGAKYYSSDVKEYGKPHQTGPRVQAYNTIRGYLVYGPAWMICSRVIPKFNLIFFVIIL
jgi:hypothetical protein